MKRVKMLLVAMLCVIVLGVTAVPAKAEVEPCPYNNGVLCNWDTDRTNVYERGQENF